MLEAEVKLKLDDATRERLVERLEGRGARLLGESRQCDEYYAHPDRDFSQTDEALRLREVDGALRITYKGPKLDVTTKTRHEIEVELAAGQEAARDAVGLLAALGFKPVAEVRKRRIHYALPWAGREIGVSIDRVAGLGDFVELEIMVQQEELETARRAIAEVSRRLDLSNSERRSYLELLLSDREDT